MNSEKSPNLIFWYLIIILIYTQLIYYLLVKLFGFSFLSSTREVFLALLLLMSMPQLIHKFNFLIFMIISTAFGVFIYLMNYSSVGFVIGVRQYIEPMIMLTATYLLSIDKDKLDIILKRLFVLFGLLSVWGVLQAYYLKDAFLINIGYEIYKYPWGLVALSPWFYIQDLPGIQRVVSTFSSPNIFAINALIALIIGRSLHKRHVITTKYYYIVNTAIIVALFLSFSRNVFLTIIILFCFKHIIAYFQTRQLSSLFVILGVVLSILFATNYLMKNKLLDNSIIDHIESYSKNIQSVIVYVGSGPGSKSPRTLGALDENVMESSYLILFSELGLFVALLYLLTYLVPVYYSSTSYYKNDICLLTFVYFISSIFFPYWMSNDFTFFYASLLGLMLGSNSGNKIFISDKHKSQVL